MKYERGTSGDASLWIKHYTAMSEGKSAPRYKHGHSRHATFSVEQSGGGSGGGGSRPVVNMISPVVQGVNQAKATLKRGIKRRRPASRNSSNKRRRTVKSTKTARKPRRKQVKRKGTKKTKKSRKPAKKLKPKKKKQKKKNNKKKTGVTGKGRKTQQQYSDVFH